MKEPQVPEGKTYVAGRSQEKSIELLELAEKAGLTGQVHTTSFGYIVPSVILDGDTVDDTEEDTDGEGTDAGGEETDAETQTGEAEEKAEEFDPSKATIDEVKEYLDGADETERERVLAAEKTGKGRKGILDLADTKGDK